MNILDVSNVSELGVVEGSAAASALQSGCEMFDAEQVPQDPVRTGTQLIKGVVGVNCKLRIIFTLYVRFRKALG